MSLTGSQILLESLKLEGVDTVFGYPGGAVINIYDDLYSSSIEHILTRHEQAAVHAADGYSQPRRFRDWIRPVAGGAAAVVLLMSVHALAEETQKIQCICEPTGTGRPDYVCTGTISCCRALLNNAAYAGSHLGNCVNLVPEVFEIWLSGRGK